MKYTIPYNDKITLPHIKKIESIGISADNLNYDRKELNGEVIITGDYVVDNSQDVMEFKHNIPVSLLIDDAKIEPQINISNFKYEVIPGRGIEVIFDLDVVLVEEVEVVKERDENNLEENNELDKENNEELEQESLKEEIEETNLNEMEEEKNEIKRFQEEIDKNLDKVLNSKERSEKEYESEKDIENLEEIEDDTFNAKLESTLSTFDTSFVPRDSDKFTTYKILLIENNESIDQVLDNKNLSKALICKEYQFDEQKVILKLEDD